MNNQSASTGTGSFAGDILMLLLMIIGGTVAAIWFSTLSFDERSLFMHRGLNFCTLVLAQPGVFMAAHIVSNENMYWKKKWILAVTVLGLVAFVIPLAISYTMYPAVEQLFLHHEP
jgi:hypothetical protein